MPGRSFILGLVVWVALLWAVASFGQQTQPLRWRQAAFDTVSVWWLYRQKPGEVSHQVVDGIMPSEAQPVTSGDPGKREYETQLAAGVLFPGSSIYLTACNSGGCSTPSNTKLVPTQTPTPTLAISPTPRIQRPQPPEIILP